MKDLPHLAARLYGTPLLIARPKLEAILAAIGPRLLGLADTPSAEAASRPAPQVLDSGIAVLPILGTLVHRSSYLEAASGLTSYAEIIDAAEALFADSRVKAVLLEIDSAGGEAGGVFAAAQRLRALSEETGKPLWAIASEAALSAAYALAAAADRLYVTDTGEVGSVGVVAVHVDQSSRDAMEGLRYTFIHAGAKKIDGNPHEPLSASARADLAADVEAIYERFVAWVARRRGLAFAAVRGQEAAVYRGEAAIRAGLADAVGSLREAVSALEDSLVPTPAAISGRPTLGGLAMHAVQPAAASAAAETPIDFDDPRLAERLAAEQARLIERAAQIVEIAEQAKALGVAIDAVAAIREGVSPDALRCRVLEEAARRDAAADIVTAAPAASPAESPLVALAKQMAKKGA